MIDRNELADADYAALADFRYALRQFLVFSERGAASCGLKPQQHQALLAIRGAASANTDCPTRSGDVPHREEIVRLRPMLAELLARVD